MNFYHKNLKGPNSNALKRSITKYRNVGFTIHTTGESYQRYIDRNIKRLAKFQQSWRSQLAKASTETLFDLLYRSKSILTNPQQMTRATYRIKSEIKRKCGLRKLPAFTISFPYDHRVNTQTLKSVTHQIIDHLPVTKTIREHTKLQVRTISTRRQTIADILTNAKRACTTFDPNNPPECIKHAE